MDHYVIYDEENQVKCDIRKYLASLKKNGIKVINVYEDAILVSDSMKTLCNIHLRNKRSKSIAERTHQIKELFIEYKQRKPKNNLNLISKKA